MTDSTNTAGMRLDIDDAVDSILIRPEDKQSLTPPTDEVTAEESAEAVVTENSAPSFTEEEDVAEAEAEATTEAESEDDEEKEESETTDEETEELEEPEDEDAEVMYTLSDGEEVTLDELKRGHLRQSDYTQKTQALAEERQAFQSDVQELGNERNITAEALLMAMNIVEPQLAEGAQTNWEALANEDAYEYAEKWAQYQQAQVRWGQLQEAGAQATQAQAQQDAARKQAYQAEQSKALQMAIPDLADPTKGKALQAALREYAQTSGLTEEEASNISDHRVVVMLNKARLYDEMVAAGKTVVQQKLSKSPKKVLKPGQPVTKSEQQTNARNAKRAALKSQGTVDAGVDWLLSG